MAKLSPLSKINLIAGQNNSGKSNVLRVVMSALNRSKSMTIWDRPLGDPEHSGQQLVAHSLDEVMGWFESAKFDRLRPQLRSFLENPALRPPGLEGDNLWLGVGTESSIVDTQAQSIMGDLARQLSAGLLSTSGGGDGADARRVMQFVQRAQPAPPRAFQVDGIRSISADSTAEPDLNGLSIKRRLQQLQSPSSERLSDKTVFEAIQEFVREVMDDASVAIDIPHDLSTIHVTQDGRTLPIENVGTGVHEVVILAAAATIVQDSILCVEEPEVHLHPILQRKLLRYLSANTTNQYFIATHSAHMLDADLGSIFHVTKDQGQSGIRYAGAARDRSVVCADLGYRPSDLVQTNAVLWVEGPSDRIYLKHWIEKLAPGRFIEGTHYSVMFYGGSLLAELSPLDAEEVDEFISLRNLNRYMAVLIDSDKRSTRGSVNASKRRVVEGVETDPSTGVAWITAGYTIENYVPEAILESAIKSVHPTTRSRALAPQDRWSDPLSEVRVGIRKASKVAIAKHVVAAWADEWPFNLRTKVRDIIALIERANAHN